MTWDQHMFRKMEDMRSSMGQDIRSVGDVVDMEMLEILRHMATKRGDYVTP